MFKKMTKEDIQKLNAKGIFFDDLNKSGNNFLVQNEDGFKQVAMDSSSQFQSFGVPFSNTNVISTELIEQIIKKITYAEIATMSQQGDFADETYQNNVIEYAYDVQPYAEGSKTGVSNASMAFPIRNVYRFQTNIRYGQLEIEKASKARIDLIGQKRKAQTVGTSLTHNDIFYYGVDKTDQGLTGFYGLLNNPANPAALISHDYWNNLTAVNVYNEFQNLYAFLAGNNAGNVKQDTQMKLLVSPSVQSTLTKVSDLLTNTAWSMIKQTYKNVELVIVPEYENEGTVQLIVTQIDGAAPTLKNAFSTLFRSFGIEKYGDVFHEKVACATFGCIVQVPGAVATMTGVSPIL